MDTKAAKQQSAFKDLPSEVELAHGRKCSQMTRDEALCALDRCTRLCVALMEANQKQRAELEIEREFNKQVSELARCINISFTEAASMFGKCFGAKQQRENAAGVPQSSKEGGGE